MDRLYFSEPLGEPPTVRRGTAPASRSSAFEAQLFFGGGGGDLSKLKAPEQEGEDDFAKHAAHALGWLQSPGGGAACAGFAAAAEPVGAVVAPPVAAAAAAPAAARAPRWAPHGIVAPTARLVRIDTPAAHARDGLRRFFADGEVPSEIDDGAAWTLRGTAFLDYVAVDVEVRLFESGDDQASCVAAFSHTSARDAVRFAELVDRARAFVLGGASVPAAPPTMMMDFDEEDLFSEEGDAAEEACLAHIEALLQGAGEGGAAVREETWQCLARWGERREECRADLAEALLVEGGSGVAVVAEAFRPATPIAELFPLAAALRFASSELHRRADPAVAEAVTAAEHLPKLVANELREVRCRLVALA